MPSIVSEIHSKALLDFADKVHRNVSRSSLTTQENPLRKMGLRRECDTKCNSQSAALPELAGLKLPKL